MTRRLSTLIAVVTLGAGLGCAVQEATGPARPAASSRADKGGVTPGSQGTDHFVANSSQFLGCTPRDAQYGTATIGSNGGELDVGTHRLIIPPGALTQTVTISGTTTDDSTLTINFEPHGLQFKKPAGLILDASNCFNVPNALYIDELGGQSDPIVAVYSNWWHTIAAPIDHFSGYMVAF